MLIEAPLLFYTAQYIKDVTDKLADLTDEISEIITDEDTLLLENEGRLKATARRAYEAFKQNAATSGNVLGDEVCLFLSFFIC